MVILNGSDASDKRYNMNCEVAFYLDWRPKGGLSEPLKHTLPTGLVMDCINSYTQTSVRMYTYVQIAEQLCS